MFMFTSTLYNPVSSITYIPELRYNSKTLKLGFESLKKKEKCLFLKRFNNIFLFQLSLSENTPYNCANL